MIQLNKNETQEKILIFLHMTKTAGTTLNGIINQQYRKKAIFNINGINSKHEINELSDSQRNMIKVFRGHMAFGLHNFLPRPCAYFTVLREPVERAISLYYYIRRNPNNQEHEQVKSISLKDYILSKGQDLGNEQTKILFGLSEVKCSCETDILETAKKNLKEHFTVVGLTDRFDETLILLKREFGWKMPVYIKQNVTKKRPLREEIPENILKVIEDSNQLDIELYKYACQRFEDSVIQQGYSFETELKRLNSLNNLYQPYGKIYSLARHVVLKHLLKVY